MTELEKILDAIYDGVDSMFKSGKFKECDDLLRSLNVDTISTDVLLGYLTSTLPAKSKLPYRPEFYKKVEETIRQRKEYEPDLLRGLE